MGASMKDLYEPLSFARGPSMKNRFMLAPMTNQQACDRGLLTDDELNWLKMRAEGDFGHVMTCCAHVNPKGQGFPGELGVYCDELLPGLTRLAEALRSCGAVSSMQLYHGGIRSIRPDRVGPSNAPEDSGRAMTLAEIEAVINDYVEAAVRAKKAGFDGVELHGAHGYLISEFLSAQYNRRQDAYGGSPQKRRRFLLDIVDGIRERCGDSFQIGVRISPERFGHDVIEQRDTAQVLCDGGKIDFLDISLWDVFKEPAETRYQKQKLIEYFTDLDLQGVRIGFAGQICGREQAQNVLDMGADFVVTGRAAILHHDLPRKLFDDPNFRPAKFPTTTEYLRSEGLGERFIDYLASWPNMVVDRDIPDSMPRFDVDEFFSTGRSAKLKQRKRL